jgi:tetratricopeptide (TPR) repeat protein
MTDSATHAEQPEAIENLSRLIGFVRRFRSKHGWPLTIAIILAIAGVALWWQWPAISERPFMDSLARLLSPEHVPVAVRGKVNVALTHLDGDSRERDNERLILDELHQFGQVQSLSIDQILGHDSETERSLALQQRTGADIIIWGTVLKVQSTTAIRLHWRADKTESADVRTQRYVPDIGAIALPPLLISDLLKMLGLLVQTHLMRLEHGPVEQSALIEFHQRIVQAMQLIARPREFWVREDLAHLKWAVAQALDSYAWRTQDRKDLQAAIQLHQQLLDDDTWIHSKEVRAAALSSLGEDFMRLDEKSFDTRALEQAVAAFRQALPLWDRDRRPRQWAATQDNLSHCLRLLGERRGDLRTLREAVDAAQAAVIVSSSFQINLAKSELALGEASIHSCYQTECLTSDDPRLAHSALDLLKAALRDMPPERDVDEWAHTETSLGHTAEIVGEATSNSGFLEDAIAAADAALSVRPRQKYIGEWFGLMLIKADALDSLDRRDSGTGRLEKAADLYREIARVVTPDFNRSLWGTLQSRLSKTLQTLGARRSMRSILLDAGTAARAAIATSDDEKAPDAWAWATVALADVYESLGKLESGDARFAEAVTLYESAINVFPERQDPFNWARIQYRLGVVLEDIGTREGDRRELQRSRLAYQRALTVLGRRKQTRSLAGEAGYHLARVEAALHRL